MAVLRQLCMTYPSMMKAGRPHTWNTQTVIIDLLHLWQQWLAGCMVCHLLGPAAVPSNTN